MLNSSSASSLASNFPTKSYHQRKWYIVIMFLYQVPDALTNDHMPSVGYSNKPHMVVDTTNAEEGSNLNPMRSWEVAIGKTSANECND
jgi:hypothetical protein